MNDGSTEGDWQIHTAELSSILVLQRVVYTVSLSRCRCLGDSGRLDDHHESAIIDQDTSRIK